MTKIQIKRGLKTNLPALAIGELAHCTDTNEVFIGTASGNIKILGTGSTGTIDGGLFTDPQQLSSDGGTF